MILQNIGDRIPGWLIFLAPKSKPKYTKRLNIFNLNSKFFSLLPVLGIFIFAALYFYSSTLYPGGSQANFDSVGFDWVHNYWCDLMNEEGMNKTLNPASRFAISAMVILCLSLMVFFIRFANIFVTGKFWKNIIRICGTLSMILAILTFTRLHGIMIALSSLFGLFALIGVLKEVYNSGYLYLKLGGLVCVLLLVLNNYIYYSRNWVETLPLLQKITFAIVLLWIMSLNIKMLKIDSSKREE